MQLKDVGVQIAIRELQASGRKITVVIGKPEMFPDGVNFYCPYRMAATAAMSGAWLRNTMSASATPGLHRDTWH